MHKQIYNPSHFSVLQVMKTRTGPGNEAIAIKKLTILSTIQ